MTLNELAYRILENYRANIKNSDPMDIRLIKSWARTTRNLLLKQRLSSSMAELSDSISQSLGEIEIEHIDSSIVPALPSSCSLFRSTITIPRTIERKNIGHSFRRIGPADRLTEKYDVLSLENALRSGHGRFNKDDIVSFILDDRIYLYTRGNLVFMPQYIDVVGVFENPITAGKINDPLYNDDSLYPISESLVEELESIVSKGNFRLTINQAEDKTEDNQHNPEG